ncbi:MAG TPA: ATP synthase subunit I [Terriglobales bacterium]|nr:ATP synthase subunit I [Terriglobales bacterium]
MTETIQSDAAESFFSGALDRIRRITLVLGVASSIAIFAIFGVAVGIGFVIGCFISYINFHWLKKAVNALADRVTQTGHAGSSSGMVVRFMLRYGFIAIGCYVILMSSKSSVYGLLGGLFLSVAAILCEAVYEVAVALRRGI